MRKIKTTYINGNTLEYHIYDSCYEYWLDDDGEYRRPDDDPDDPICYDNAFEGDIYVNGSYIAYIRDDIYQDYSCCDAIDALIDFGFSVPEAIDVYNHVAMVMGDTGYYSAEHYQYDKEEKNWYNRYKDK